MGFFTKAKEVEYDTVADDAPTGMVYPGFVPQGYVRPGPMRPESAKLNRSDSPNNIDRGDYDHGVPDHDKQVKDQPAAEQDEVSDSVDEEVPDGVPHRALPMEPIPVRLVEANVNERIVHQVDGYTLAADTPTRILGQDSRRVVARLQVAGAPVVLLNDASVPPIVGGVYVGYTMTAGGATADQTLTSQDEVWVMGAVPAAQSVLNVLVERAVNIDPQDSGAYGNKS